MTRLLLLAALAVLLALLIILAVLVFVDGVPLASAAPASQDPGSFCLGKYHCYGGDCENGLTDPFLLSIPPTEAICRVDFYVSATTIIPVFENGCTGQYCVFNWPFGPTLIAYTFPHDRDVQRITVHVNERRYLHEPVVLWNYPYPYPPPQ